MMSPSEGEIVSLSSNALPLGRVGLQIVDLLQVVTALLSEIEIFQLQSS